MVMLHVQKYLARKVRFFKLYNCNNYLFLDILYEFERNFKNLICLCVVILFTGEELHLAYLNNFLFCSRVLKHNQYVEIKQFFKVGSKQNNVSTFTWLIKFLVINARDPRLWEEVTFLQFCLHKEVRNFSNI